MANPTSITDLRNNRIKPLIAEIAENLLSFLIIILIKQITKTYSFVRAFFFFFTKYVFVSTF